MGLFDCKVLIVGEDNSINRSIAEAGREKITYDINNDHHWEKHEVNNQIWIGAGKDPKEVDAVIITLDMSKKNAFNEFISWLDHIRFYANKNLIITVALTNTGKILNNTKQEIESFLFDEKLPFVLTSENYKNPFMIISPLGYSKEALYAVINKKYVLENPSERIATTDEIDALLNLIRSKCEAIDYWKIKVRSGYGTQINAETETKIPEGIAQLLVLLNDKQAKPKDTLKRIGELASSKHSPYFQFAHFFVRGRHEDTNNFYGALAKIQGNAKKGEILANLTKELKYKFDDVKPSFNVYRLR
jgi:hypothetical protein